MLDILRFFSQSEAYLISFTFLFLLPSFFSSTYINIFLLHHVFQINLLVPTSKHNAVPSRSTWLAVLIALVGLFLLSGSRLDDLELGEGHIHLLLCVFFLSQSLSKLLPALSPLPHSSPIIRVKDSSGVTCFLYISPSLSLTLSLPNSVSLCLSPSLSLPMPLTHFSLLRIGGESDDSVYSLLDSSHYLYWYGNSLRGQHQYDVHSIGCCHSFVMFGRLAFRGDFTHYYFDNLICCSFYLFNFAFFDMIRQDSIEVTIWFDSSSIIIIDSFYLNTVLWLSKLYCALLVILNKISIRDLITFSSIELYLDFSQSHLVSMQCTFYLRH